MLPNPIPLPLEELAPPPALFAHASDLHGVAHVSRVMVHGFLLVEATGLAEEASRFWGAAFLHDLARTHDGRCRVHGADAAARLPELADRLARGGVREEDHDAIRTAVTAHSLPEELPDDHPHRPLTALLKDADALDRFRLDDLDPRYLRFPASHRLLGFAERLWRETDGAIPPGPDYLARLWPVAERLLEE